MKWLLIIRHVNSVEQCRTVSTVSTVSTVIARCYLHLRWYFFIRPRSVHCLDLFCNSLLLYITWIRQECTNLSELWHGFVKRTDICPFFGIYLEISSIIKYLKLKKFIWKRAFASRRLLHFGIVLPSHIDRQELVFKPEKSQQTENSFWQGISRAGDLGWGMMGRKPGARQLDWKPHHPLPPLSSVSPSSPALI